MINLLVIHNGVRLRNLSLEEAAREICMRLSCDFTIHYNIIHGACGNRIHFWGCTEQEMRCMVRKTEALLQSSA